MDEPPCPIAAKVAADIMRRAEFGRSKYGTNLARTDLSRRDWLVHVYEEVLDTAGYLRVLIEREDTDDPNTLPLELMPEGHTFHRLSRTAHGWSQELHRTWDWTVVTGQGSTPRAALLAAVEAAKNEG